MNRFQVLQSLIDKTKAQNYVEIGVRDGIIIKKISAPYKFGIDPDFSFNRIDTIKSYLHLLNFKTFKMTSDTFFEDRLPKKIIKNGIDVAFVDGLHTYQQALKDAENCLKHLTEKGFIVLHDCNPTSYAGAYPVKNSMDELKELENSDAFKNWDKNWNGDVWKALVHLRITHGDLEIFTIDADWGLGIIKKGKSEKLNALTVEELQKADYYTLENNRESLLNLKQPQFFNEFLDK